MESRSCAGEGPEPPRAGGPLGESSRQMRGRPPAPGRTHSCPFRSVVLIPWLHSSGTTGTSTLAMLYAQTPLRPFTLCPPHPPPPLSGNLAHSCALCAVLGRWSPLETYSSPLPTTGHTASLQPPRVLPPRVCHRTDVCRPQTVGVAMRLQVPGRAEHLAGGGRWGGRRDAAVLGTPLREVPGTEQQYPKSPAPSPGFAGADPSTSGTSVSPLLLLAW